jgi:hypothetical protein
MIESNREARAKARKLITRFGAEAGRNLAVAAKAEGVSQQLANYNVVRGMVSRMAPDLRNPKRLEALEQLGAEAQAHDAPAAAPGDPEVLFRLPAKAVTAALTACVVAAGCRRDRFAGEVVEYRGRGVPAAVLDLVVQAGGEAIVFKPLSSSSAPKPEEPEPEEPEPGVEAAAPPSLSLADHVAGAPTAMEEAGEVPPQFGTVPAAPTGGAASVATANVAQKETAETWVLPAAKQRIDACESRPADRLEPARPAPHEGFAAISPPIVPEQAVSPPIAPEQAVTPPTCAVGAATALAPAAEATDENGRRCYGGPLQSHGIVDGAPVARPAPGAKNAVARMARFAAPPPAPPARSPTALVVSVAPIFGPRPANGGDPRHSPQEETIGPE